MLDREVVEELLSCEFEEIGLKIPKDINKQELVEAFCQYSEDDYYEWLKDNFESFFNHGNPEWEWIRERIRYYSEMQ